jgi:1-aminocyclopropane-1-carboxylate deaminase
MTAHVDDRAGGAREAGVSGETRTSLDAFERYPLLFGPSPVHRLDRLTSHLGGAALWAKRDDCNSGLAYGGNKTRKLEYLVADALAEGCDTLVSIGGVQSNHTRQVAAVAARTGMGCVLVQESWVDWPDVTYDRVGNIQLSRIMGADVRLVKRGSASASRRAGSGRWPTSRPRAEALRDPGGRLGPQARGPGLRQLGLRGRGAGAGARTSFRHHRRVLGHRQHAGRDDRRVRRAGARARVIGIDGSAKPAETREQVARIARNTAGLIGLGRTCARTRSSSTTATTPAPTASPTSGRWRPYVSPGAWRG